MSKRPLIFSGIQPGPKTSLLVFCLLGFCFCLDLIEVAAAGKAKQTDAARPLALAEKVERELAVGETHRYQITLAADSYLRISINLSDTKIEPKLLVPNSAASIGPLFAPNLHGSRLISFIAETAGTYCLEIRLTEGTKAGRYEVKLEELRPATEKDKIHTTAEHAESAGHSLMNFASSAEKRRQAIAKFEEALALWRQLGEHNGVLRMLSYLSNQYRYIGEVQTALEYRKQTIEVARTIGDQYQEANQILGIGLFHLSSGENQKALDAFNQGRQLFKKLSKRYGEAIAIQNIASTLIHLGEWQNALPYLEEALPTMSSVGDRFAESNILNMMGDIHATLGNKQKGLEFQQRALTLVRSDKPVDNEAIALGHLGNAYLDLGDRQKALECYEQALKLCQTLGKVWCEGDSLKRLGDVAYLSGDYPKALSYFEQSLALYQTTWERASQAKALHALAQVNYALGNFDKAKNQLEQALEIQESLRAKVIDRQLRDTIFSSAQSSFALYIDLLQQMHKKDPAAGYEAAALQASERARARSLLDLLSESQADIREGVSKNLLELERSLQQQLNAKAAARTRLLSDKSTQTQAASFDKEISELTARYRQVEVQIRQSSPRYAALTQPQPLSAQEIQQQLDDQTVLLEFALGEKQSWLWAVTRASINSYQLASSNEIEPAARQVYELLIARQPRKGESEAQYQARVSEAEATFASQSARLSQLLFGQLATKLHREWRGKRLAIVASGTLEYIPFAVLPVPVVGGQGSEVGGQGSGGSEAGIGGQRSGISEAEVGGQRSGISKEESRSHKVTRQDISKDRPPTTDPCPPTTDPCLLIAEHEIINLPSASVLALIRKETGEKKAAEKTIAVIADPVFELTDPRVLKAMRQDNNKNMVVSVRSGEPSANATQAQAAPVVDSDLGRALRSFDLLNERGGFSRLPFSREEAEAIATLAGKTALMKATDFQATRTVATSGELARFRILHFATHGLLNSERPELSGLVLSLVDEHGKSQDGFLRMHEIYNLHLPADLVVLSACQTALGKQIKGEGLVGLTRGFMYAGAERVVASLWQVDDLATAELMKRFYRGMLKDGRRPAAALRAAQLEMLKQKRWSAPYFWAAFTIQGEWR